MAAGDAFECGVMPEEPEIYISPRRMFKMEIKDIVEIQ